jgi:hypothetical protein
MLTSEMRPEIRVRDAPLISLVPLGARTVAILPWSLGLRLLMPVLFVLLLLHVLPRLILLLLILVLLILAARRWLHLTFVLLTFRMTVPALRRLLLLSLILRSHLPPVSAPGFLIPAIVISPILGSRFILVILCGRRSLRPLVLVFVLRDRQPCRSQQQAS